MTGVVLRAMIQCRTSVSVISKSLPVLQPLTSFVSSVTRQSGILILFTANIGFLRLVCPLSLLSYIDINRVDAGSR